MVVGWLSCKCVVVVVLGKCENCEKDIAFGSCCEVVVIVVVLV